VQRLLCSTALVTETHITQRVYVFLLMSRFHVADAFFCAMLLHGTVCYGSASVIAIVSRFHFERTITGKRAGRASCVRVVVDVATGLVNKDEYSSRVVV